MEWFTEELKQELYSMRHHLHQHPELGNEEVETSAFIEEKLKALPGMEVMRPTKTSVLGTLKGKHPGKTLLMRADMDALPLTEEVDLPYKSQNPGVMHACGHDTHVAMLLTAAKALSGMAEQLHGTVKFIFQHAEEVLPGGAKFIVDSGALGDYDAVMGIHINQGREVGSFQIVPEGAGSTNSDTLQLTIQGKGAHGAMPQEGVDSILIGAEIVQTLQSVVARSVAPDDMAVVTVGSFHAGKAPNIIADTAQLGLSIRSVSDETRQLLAKRIRDIVDGICKAHGATYNFDYMFGYPAIQQDKELAAFVKKCAVELVGPEKVMDSKRLSGSEDFSYYGQKAPACFLMLGAGLPEDGYAYGGHHPKYCIDETAMEKGVELEVKVAQEFLKG